MRCPQCKHYVELTAKAVKGTNLDLEQCPDCKGLWFDRNELSAVLKLPARELNFPDNARESRNLCPRCKIPLHLFCYPQTTVIIDACRQCDGIWLDGNEIWELKTVRNSLEKGGSVDAGKKDLMVCPKCGHTQDQSKACIKCGIVFSKYNRTAESKTGPVPNPAPKAEQAPSGIKGQLLEVINSAVDSLMKQIVGRRKPS